ncbi:MAG: hypothetical protein KAH56_00315 [Candidatus Krumholzibacteria bacterium]|nr:hypothetical protein [Candidatus Krumholzibacteria bacterium]
MKTKILIGLTMLTLVFGAQVAMADCFIGGTITASANPDPMGPIWMYTMEITWDTGNNYSLSHANLLMDPGLGTCLCQDFVDALSWGDPIGSSNGYPEPCTVQYSGYLECEGDPSIPEVTGYLLKFEPIEDEFCEPGPTGTGTFIFYSNLPPAPIDEEILSVVDKHAGEYCFGNMSGEFPAMACDPVGDEGSSWGNLKGIFR